jgi:hypothetical protein
MQLLKFCKRCLLSSLAVGMLVVPAGAQFDRCAEAVSLWLPSGAAGQQNVSKWGKAIKYGIAPADDDQESMRMIEGVLQFIARESGLQMERDDGNSTLDLSIAVPPEIATFATNARTYVQGYFQDLVTKKGMKGTITIDAAGWEPQYRTITPKCGGLNLRLAGIVERAFVMIQRGEGPLCAEVALAEVFGVTNIRMYYLEHGQDVPADIAATAVRTLYDKRVKPGMTRGDANRVTGTICR